MELLGGVHQLEGEGVLVAAQAANLASIPGLDHYHIALATLALVRIKNRLAQTLGRPAADRGQVRRQAAATPVHLMTCRAPAFAEEDSLSSGRFARNLLLDNGSAEAADVAYQLPDLGWEHVEARHLGTGNTLTDILKDLRVLAAVQKVASGERWPAPPACIAAMADLAGLLVQFLASGDCFRIA